MERDACEKTGKLSDFNFNSHAHVERDSGISQRTFCIAISTHTLTWSVTISTGYTAKVQKISTHTLTWSVTSDRYYWNYLWQFQLTRSRGAWHGRKWKNCTWIYISTHTLTWSVTWRFQQMMFTLYDFNSHAHVERDLNSNCGDKWRYHFNSHAHVERDYFSDVSDMLHKISTHTLTWSVTVCSEI